MATRMKDGRLTLKVATKEPSRACQNSGPQTLGSYICSRIDSDRAGGDLRNSDDPCIFSCGDPAASDDFLLNDTDHCQTAAERKKPDFEKDSE